MGNLQNDGVLQQHANKTPLTGNSDRTWGKSVISRTVVDRLCLVAQLH